MVRWEPGAQERLQRAALELYAERGFEQVTVAQIAQRAGLTERTFFRYFTDKREVLFDPANSLQASVESEVAGAPQSARPMEAVAAALDSVALEFEGRRDFSRQRQSVIASHGALQERELIKLAALAAATAAALRGRGVAEPAASLAAEAGIAIFKIAFELWVDEAEQRELAQIIRDLLVELKAVAAGG